ncbi:hypothetical protein V2J09_015890 [Rumex salicifolius]
MAAASPFSSLPALSTTTRSTVDSLDQQFARKGIKFSDFGDVPSVELSVRNGSSVRLRIPDALVTSYKPKVFWKDDGFEEVLFTVPAPAAGSQPSPSREKGGIGLVINQAPESNVKSKGPGAGSVGGGSVLSDADWFVKNVDSDSFDAVQVELGCTSGSLDITYVVSLYPLSMATAVIVKNNGRKAVNLTSAILGHFRSTKRGGTAITGLQGCSYCSYPPLPSPFEILSPAEAMKADDAGLFSFAPEPLKPGVWTEQDERVTVLKHKLSRVYSSPPSERANAFHRTIPSKFETIDQGRELFFRVIRMGFDDIYVSSPGSFSKKYGQDYFICAGSASMMVPVTVNPGDKWRGAQVIEHDNLSLQYQAISMANSLVFSSKLTHLFSTKPTKTRSTIRLHPSLSNSTALHHQPLKGGFPTPSVSSASFTPINVDYLETEFGSEGVSFTALGESCVVNMVVENGSVAKLMLPSGLITSYKPRLWHGGSQEVLHTSVSNGGEDGDQVFVKGGVSLALGCEGKDGFSWSPTHWALKDVRGNRTDGIQVEIVSREPDNEVEVQYTISLVEDGISSVFNVSNLGSSMLELRGTIISHLTVSTPDATYAVGLEGSNFYDRPPISSHFSINPPDVENSSIFNGLFSASRDMEVEETKGSEGGEEMNNYKHLTDKMSRIYTSAPRNFTIIDRGKRNSVDVGRNGFEEVYMYSPGSAHEWYGEYAYVCVGQTAMLKPIRLDGGQVWRGMQQLHNPNI